MIWRPDAPAPPAPRAPLAPESPSAPPLVDAPPAGAVLEEDPPTCVPAVGGSTVVGFLGQPASSAAPANKQAIDIIRFIHCLRQRFTLNPSLPTNLPIVHLVRHAARQKGDHAGSCTTS